MNAFISEVSKKKPQPYSIQFLDFAKIFQYHSSLISKRKSINFYTLFLEKPRWNQSISTRINIMIGSGTMVFRIKHAINKLNWIEELCSIHNGFIVILSYCSFMLVYYMKLLPISIFQLCSPMLSEKTTLW